MWGVGRELDRGVGATLKVCFLMAALLVEYCGCGGFLIAATQTSHLRALKSLGKGFWQIERISLQSILIYLSNIKLQVAQLV